MRLTIEKWDPPGRKRSIESGYAENVLLRESSTAFSERQHRHFLMRNRFAQYIEKAINYDDRIDFYYKEGKVISWQKE